MPYFRACQRLESEPLWAHEWLVFLGPSHYQMPYDAIILVADRVILQTFQGSQLSPSIDHVPLHAPGGVAPAMVALAAAVAAHGLCANVVATRRWAAETGENFTLEAWGFK